MNTIYRFHDCELRIAQRQLLVGDQPARLGSRAFDLLQMLVERRERVVHKHEILDHVWPRLVVEENNLQVHVLALRKLLGHGAIATIPGRGYRFTLPVTVDGDPGVAALARDEGPPALIGRDTELVELRALLGSHTLVTVAGSGGIGKTRLARSAVHALAESPTVGWVDLAGIDDEATLLLAVAQALGIRVDAAADLRSVVVDALRSRQALLVLDNAEHLLETVAALVSTLRAAATGLRLLVTSQEMLHLADEQVFRPGPLALPADDAFVSVRDSAAVALFLARVRLVQRHFELDDDNRAAIADICRRLDGIPLAIELAAARVPLLGVEGVRSRLDERFALLTAGDRAAMRRHQTLRAALDWSHGLMSTAEQRALSRLSVCVGGFTLEAAQYLIEDEAIDRWDALEMLAALVDKSMVVAEGLPLPRYRLLETTRLYGLERLADAGATEAALLQHAGFSAQLAERCDAEIARHGQGRPWLALLDAERDNLLHALAWCGSRDAPAAATAPGLRLLAAMRYYWTARGLMSVGSRLAAPLLERGRASPDAVYLQALATAAQQLGWQGRHVESRALTHELLAIADATGANETSVRARVMIGHQAADEGRLDDAERWFDDALTRARAAGFDRARSAALNGLIVVAGQRRDFDRMVALGDEVLTLQRAAGNAYNLCTTLLNLAIGALDATDAGRALRLVAEAGPWVAGADSVLLDLMWLQLAPPVVVATADAVDLVAIYAAAEALERAAEVDRHEQLGTHRERLLARAREALGVEGFDRAWAEGRALQRAAARDRANALLQAALGTG